MQKSTPEEIMAQRRSEARRMLAKLRLEAALVKLVTSVVLVVVGFGVVAPSLISAANNTLVIAGFLVSTVALYASGMLFFYGVSDLRDWMKGE